EAGIHIRRRSRYCTGGDYGSPLSRGRPAEAMQSAGLRMNSMPMPSARRSAFDFVDMASNPTGVLVAVLAIVFGLLVVPPLWFLLEGSLHTTTVTGAVGDFTWLHYQRLLSDRQFFRSLANSVIFGLGS